MRPSRHTRTPGDNAGSAIRRTRSRIAELAARLIAEHGIADWSLAKRKAARQLLACPIATPLPGERGDRGGACTHITTLFGGDEQPRRCAVNARRR